MMALKYALLLVTVVAGERLGENRGLVKNGAKIRIHSGTEDALAAAGRLSPRYRHYSDSCVRSNCDAQHTCKCKSDSHCNWEDNSAKWCYIANLADCSDGKKEKRRAFYVSDGGWSEQACMDEAELRSKGFKVDEITLSPGEKLVDLCSSTEKDISEAKEWTFMGKIKPENRLAEVQQLIIPFKGVVERDIIEGPGSTALYEAARNGFTDIAKLLDETYPLLAEVEDQHGGTALHAAARSGSLDIAKMLHKNHPDLFKVVNGGKYPKDVAETFAKPRYAKKEGPLFGDGTKQWAIYNMLPGRDGGWDKRGRWRDVDPEDRHDRVMLKDGKLVSVPRNPAEPNKNNKYPTA